LSYRILVPLDDSDWSRSAAQLALWLADRSPDAVTVTGLHVINVTQSRGAWLEDLAGHLGFEPVIVPEKVEQTFRERGEALINEFEGQCQTLGITFQTELVVGSVVDRIVHHGDHHDLLVMGVRGETETRFPGQGGGTTERVLRRASISVLTVPRHQRGLTGIALGYDGSDGAARALNTVRHLSELAALPVHVFFATEGAPEGVSVQEAISRLEATGVQAIGSEVIGRPEDALPAGARAAGCDLLALGYRGRSQLKDIFLGRTTEWLVGKLDMAILVAR